ncbi:hypothetical protein RH831_09440 [Halodesulfurarchaeum sp. HSR-GB]|uniref:hypothetical protein n=1 Tax=Halodesulfurarchaeum sp. HSR-GB TaxID=3074077 RepID=UPI0028585866|nr:hypothetical protein [Halodesulfurarchaeum sp. HSR-GB]MDR5657402.1 hypothetical protein [Halodesulfurarchaeum sp. HSR-GB]
MPSRSASWFHGYVAWYLRGAIWFVQTAVVGLALVAILGTKGLAGTAGMILTGLFAALLLFRQVDMHVKQEIAD